MSEVLEKRFYRDPLETLISIENGTCAGCVHKFETLGLAYCNLGKRFGNKCKSYDDGECVNGKS